MKLKNNIATSESGFIFNPSTGDSFSTNPIGNEIIALIKEGKKTKEILSSIVEKYDIEEKTFEKDLDDFLCQLQDNNLLSV